MRVRRSKSDVRLGRSSGVAAAGHGEAQALHGCPRPRSDAPGIEDIVEYRAWSRGPVARRGGGSGDLDFDQLIVTD